MPNISGIPGSFIENEFICKNIDVIEEILKINVNKVVFVCAEIKISLLSIHLFDIFFFVNKTIKTLTKNIQFLEIKQNSITFVSKVLSNDFISGFINILQFQVTNGSKFIRSLVFSLND